MCAPFILRAFSAILWHTIRIDYMTERTLKIGVLGSGNGSNFVAIADAIASGHLRGVDVGCVLCDVPDAGILSHAAAHGIPAQYLPADDFRTKLDGAQEAAYCAALRDAGVDYIVLAGFMRMVKQGLLRAFPQHVINIHPSLLPAFPGLRAWEQAYEYGVKVTGCTVHFVDEGMDTGPIIAQASVPVYDTDTPSLLHARIQEQEHVLYPRVLQWLADDMVRCAGRRVMITYTE